MKMTRDGTVRSYWNAVIGPWVMVLCSAHWCSVLHWLYVSSKPNKHETQRAEMASSAVVQFSHHGNCHYESVRRHSVLTPPPPLPVPSCSLQWQRTLPTSLRSSAEKGYNRNWMKSAKSCKRKLIRGVCLLDRHVRILLCINNHLC